MAKNKSKRSNIRMRRRIRKTMGVVCLITALLIAAIPVPEVSAADDTKYLWDNEIGIKNTVIPVVPQDCKTIYTTGDGTYQFAFVNASSTSPDKIAVILGYNAGNLTNNYLAIPDTVDAFTKYSENQGTRTGYVAVSKTQKPLYYQATPDIHSKDVSGNDYISAVATYKPCYYADYSTWSTLDLANFYYRNDAGIYIKTESSSEQWIKNITVMYIGNQSLTANTSLGASDGAVQEWVIAEPSGEINTSPANGVFSNESNIKTLVVGNSLMGIGNYAFYGCTGLESIQLGNGLTEVGKYAFANCVNMNSIGIDFTSRLQYISDYTFLNCRALAGFIIPASVTSIYDHAFEGCSRLGSEGTGGVLDLSGAQAGKNVTLSRMGYSVFKGCTSLASVTMPESISSSTDVVNINNFEGCNALRRITVQSPYTTFGGTTNYTVDHFKSDIAETFYFECAGDSATHTYTKANAIAFKYSDRDCYEMIKIEQAVDGSSAELTYQVNSNNELLLFNMNKPVTEVNIPAAIGPYGISAINSGSFSGNCFLNKITIPATVTKINDSAFKGCHNLKDVIFANAANITYIGTDAFATQKVEGVHATDCKTMKFLTEDLSPKLSFTGVVGKGIVPFDYAMNASSTINAGQQTKSYITYYSGWPTNLEIKYVVNADTGEGAATLIDYPTYAEVEAKTKYKQGAYPYMTADFEAAASEAITQYKEYIVNKSTKVTDYQWQIINAALKLNVPSGVNAIATGLFSGVKGVKQADGTYVVEKVTGQSADNNIQSITLTDINKIEPYSFTGCKLLHTINLSGAAERIDDYAFAYAYTVPETKSGSDSVLKTLNMTGGGSSIGDYAFCNNALLTDVNLSSTVSAMGLRPFKDCPIIEDVNFSGGPYFKTESAIIYGLKDGKKDLIVQCLESRGKTVNTPSSVASAEVSGVSSIAKEAFMDCEGIGAVDLSASSVAAIPERAFANTTSLYSTNLPTSCKSISKYAFGDSNLRYLDVPSSVTFIDPLAFNTEQNANAAGKYNIIEFYCEPGSAAETYAKEFESIKTTEKPVSTTFTVIFWDYDGKVLDSQKVLIGQSAVAPASPIRAGYTFDGWLPNFTAISKDTDVVAQYTKIDSADTKYTVRFIDYNDAVLYTQKIVSGEDAIPPQVPVRTGYTFTGWRPAITNVTKDFDCYAQYEKNTTGTGSGSGSGTGNGNGTNNGGPTVSGNNNASTLYSLTVKNGSGSGSYVAGATVIILADEPAKTQEFSKWTTDNNTIKFASTSVAATTMVMPAANTTVTANFINKTATGGGTGSSTVPSVTANSGNNSGTVIVIDKNGLSNTGVVSATVNGSSDNFVIKVSENATATESIVKALMNEYGSLDNIKYFPMDISLYDSTGKTKITDTTGFSINITLPLPDSMASYAGNNKVAGVVNDELDKLTPKFTTIDGTACINFTAEHFSPYVIYVNTSNLESVGVTDSSPKTGDIQPKWFIVIGLTCLAVVLFVKRDKSGKNILVKA